MRDDQKGILALIISCTVWGLSPLYYVQLRHVPALEVLSYRCLWSLAFFSLVLLIQGRLREVPRALAVPRQALVILAAAVTISANWFGFIYAVGTGQGLEASLGYYIFPLVAVLLGQLFFAERLSRLQWAAIVLAALGVAVLTLGLGVAPWIALSLAATFGMYGLIKKKIALGPVLSVNCEVLLLAPLACAWIAVMGTGAGGGNSWQTHGLLALSGPLTAMPLVLFSYAARRIRLATVGLVQYLNPTLQFACAVMVLSEVVTIWHIYTFPIIWAALTIYSVAALRQDRAARKAAAIAGTSSAT